MVIAGISQAALLVWGCNRSGAKVHWRLPRLTPPVKALIMAAVPGALAASASQINVWVSGTLVSHVDGAVSWLSVCDRLYQLPQGLVGVAIATRAPDMGSGAAQLSGIGDRIAAEVGSIGGGECR